MGKDFGICASSFGLIQSPHGSLRLLARPELSGSYQGTPLRDGTRASFSPWKIFLVFETRYFLPIFSRWELLWYKHGGVILFIRSKKKMVGHLQQCFVVNFSFRALTGVSTMYLCSCFLFLSKESSPWLETRKGSFH